MHTLHIYMYRETKINEKIIGSIGTFPSLKFIQDLIIVLINGNTSTFRMTSGMTANLDQSIGSEHKSIRRS